MKRINKKLILLISITSILFLSIGITLFAYFSFNKEQDVSAESGITDENVVLIASFDDLFNNSKASSNNDSNKVTNANNRKILRLTSNIDLTNDIIITNDVHLDLNGKTINLNDHELQFKNGYAGTFSMYGGVVSLGTKGTGKITIDLPYASFITNSMTYNNNGTTINEEECVNLLNIDPKYTAYSALYLIGNNIASDINKRVEFEDFNTVNDELFDISDDKFIYTKTSCASNSGNEDVCSYIYKDLDLPNHYLSTDIEITYESNNKAILTNDGKVTLPDTSADVNLTASINHKSWDNPISCTFKLHVVNLSNSTIKNQVAKQLLMDYISDYYHGTDLRVNETILLEDYYYEFNHGVKLPLLGLDGTITYSYTVSDLAGNSVNTTSHNDGNTYILEPNGDCFHLVITYNDSITESLNMYSAYVGDYETIARLILNKLYGGAIIYDSSQPKKGLYKFDQLGSELGSLYSYVTSYNITELSYSLKTGSDALTYYNYSNYELTVIDGQVPPAKSSYLTVTFTFGSGTDAQNIDIDLYIDYLAESGDTLSGFLSYYNLYDPMVVTDMTQSFEMPFCFGTGAPYICYDFANVFELESITAGDEEFNKYTYTLGMPSSLKIVLSYNNGATTFKFNTYSSEASLTAQLDAYLSNPDGDDNTNDSITLSQIAQSGDAKYIFTIDAQNATTNSVNMLLLYNYKFNPASDWNLYKYRAQDSNDYITELTSSTFTVDGGLFWNSTSTATNAVQDKYFFAWIYNNFNPDASEADIQASSVNSDSFIPKSWLSLDVALDKTIDSTLSSVTNYAGIGNLTKITKVNLSGITLSPQVLTSISSMTSVTELNLSGCGISDISAICNMNSIKVLDVSNNTINNFNDLIKLTNLEEVYVYSNNATTNNPINGSLGITNLQTYNDLLRNGVSVFNQVSGGIPVIYADSDDYNDYVKLKSLIYQNKLSKKVSIETLYDPTIKNVYTVNNLSLQNTGGTFTWGYGGGTDAKDATYFYVNYTFDENTVNVKFYVDRY